MSKVTIIANQSSPLTVALEGAIAKVSPQTIIDSVTPEQVQFKSEQIYCPLTLAIPNYPEPLGAIIRSCREINNLRAWVERVLEYGTGEGVYFLPIVLTAKGPLYAEAIAPTSTGYQQPFDLTDDLRQPLYHLAWELLEHLQATPGVYTLQFGLEEKEVLFDRLYPFPTECAIASIGIQQPDLLTSHWLCLTHQPILDLTII